MNRPIPPAELCEPGDSFAPAFDVAEWLRAAIISETGPLHNPEHSHLEDAVIGVLWTNVPNVKGGVEVVGTAEMPQFRGSAWQRARQQALMRGWFGSAFEVMNFLITLYAPFFAVADNYTWCAGNEHELYHCGQARDEYGDPKWRKDGSPVYALRGHDVEVFLGEVRRYGPGAAAGRTAELMALAGSVPEVGASQVRAACGTCLHLVA